MILTCIILKIKAQLNQLINWKLWVALFYPEQSIEFWQNLHISQFILVINLLKDVYRKIMSEIHFVGKTRYEDLTETGS